MSTKAEPRTYQRQFDPAYLHRPAFAFTIDGGDYLMRDDGAVFCFNHETGAWNHHSTLPGTPAAQPEREPSV